MLGTRRTSFVESTLTINEKRQGPRYLHRLQSRLYAFIRNSQQCVRNINSQVLAYKLVQPLTRACAYFIQSTKTTGIDWISQIIKYTRKNVKIESNYVALSVYITVYPILLSMIATTI